MAENTLGKLGTDVPYFKLNNTQEGGVTDGSAFCLHVHM